MAAPIAWILGGAALVGGYLLLKDDKEEKKKSERREFERVFGRMSLAVELCGPITEQSDAMMDSLEKAVVAQDYAALEDVVRRHCPQAFEVSDDDAAKKGQIMLQAMETALGTGLTAVEVCPQLADGEQIDLFFQQFYQDIVEIGPLGAAATFRTNVISVCPAIESVSGEEIQRRGRDRMIELGLPT